MSLSILNSFESLVHNPNNVQIPVINKLWVSNIKSSSLTLNWKGIFNKISIYNGNFIVYANKKKINITIQNINTEYFYSITPIINNQNGNSVILQFQYVFSTPIININSSIYNISNETGINSYKNGTYNITSSSFGKQPNLEKVMYNYYAFDNLPNTYWLNNFETYLSNVNNYVTNLQSSSPSWNDSSRTVKGEWLQIQLPYEIQLYNYNILFYNEYHSIKFYIAGSINGIDWDALDFKTNNSSNVVSTINILKSYSYFRFISNINNAINPTVIGVISWVLNGIKS
jgi:hypothetical protein